MHSSLRQSAWRFLPAVFLAVTFLGWLWLYTRFLRYYFLVPNPFTLPLSLLQWLPGLAAAIFAVRRIREGNSLLRRAWFFLSLAVVLWPLADILENLMPPGFAIPAVALSRLVHALAYFFALSSVFFFTPAPGARFGRLRFLLDMLIQAVSWGLLLWFLLVEPILQPGASGFGAGFWIALYAILDLVVLMLILWLQGQARHTRIHLWLLAGGFFLFSVHDIVSGWIALQGGSQPYIWTGFLMLGGYASIIGATAAPERALETADQTASDEPGRFGWRRLQWRWQRIEARWLPLASTIALALFLLAEWSRSGVLDPLLAACTVALSLLLFLREGVIAGQTELAGYAVLLENIEDPACICTDEGMVTLDNSPLQKLYPVPCKGRRLVDLLPVRPGWDFLLREAREDGWRGEVWVAADGRGGFPAWLVLQRLPKEEGQRERFAALLHDLSPQRKQEESLRAAYRQAEESRKALEELSGQLEEKVRDKTADLSRALAQLEEQNRLLRSLDRMKSEFVALTSHELRTPLAGIRAGLELILSRKPALPKNATATLVLVEKESDRLARFVENILDLSALETGRLPLQIGPLRLQEPLEAARMALAAAHGGLASRNLKRLEIHLAENLPDVLADEHILASVFFQLIDNAFKYAPEGPVQATAQGAEDRVEVVIADQGPGVPAEQRERLFTMFSRLEDYDSPRVRGVGLGLYISRKMVEAMGGTIDLSPADRGLTLRLCLPRFTEEP